MLITWRFNVIKNIKDCILIWFCDELLGHLKTKNFIRIEINLSFAAFVVLTYMLNLCKLQIYFKSDIKLQLICLMAFIKIIGLRIFYVIIKNKLKMYIQYQGD